MPFPPIIITSVEGAEEFTYDISGMVTPTNLVISGSESTIATSRKDNLLEVNSTGDYYVAEDGLITTFTPLSSPETLIVTYTFDTFWDSYDGSSFNVIPDFAVPAGVDETPLCAVTGDGPHLIVFPTVKDLTGYPSGLVKDVLHWNFMPWTGAVSYTHLTLPTTPYV